MPNSAETHPLNLKLSVINISGRSLEKGNANMISHTSKIEWNGANMSASVLFTSSQSAICSLGLGGGIQLVYVCVWIVLQPFRAKYK